MALVRSLTPNVIPPKSESGDTLITSETLNTAVRDTFINRTALSADSYPDIFNTLLRHGEGYPVIVEYFKKRGPYINNQSIDTSLSMERAAVHFSFDLIHNFEIRIKDQLEIQTDTETTETSISGSALVYPGFKPNVGDVFYLKLPDDNVGVFIVNLTEPLSIYRGTYYQINFHLDGFVTEPSHLKMMESVSDELYFDKQHYFSDEATLLSHSSYKQLEALIRYRKSLITFITSAFYNTSEKTVIVPEKIYDPYLVEWLQNKISIKDVKADITQLGNPYIDTFKSTIWQCLLNQEVIPLKYTGYTLNVYRFFIFDTNVSNVDQYRIVSLVDPTESLDRRRLTPAKFEPTDEKIRSVQYIFSNRFYYLLKYAFDSGAIPTEALDYTNITDIDKIYENRVDMFYSFHDNQYHDINFFDTHTKITGSNNDIGLPEYEYIVLQYILTGHIDSTYPTEKILHQFPFSKMTPYDQLYLSAVLIHLIDITLTRIR